MESPLWIDTHAPSLEDLPQPDLRRYLGRASEGPINLVLHGPAGAGKTAAVRALAEETHADPENDLIELNVADFFDRTKKEIREDPRFERFLQGQTEFSKRYLRGGDSRNRYKRDWSKRDMITHVLKEHAAHAPSSGSYKTVLLDNAETIREDFQQALRRVMERHYETTQFVIATRQPTKLIPAIKSRCFPVPVRAPTAEETVSVLEGILEAEGVGYDPTGVRLIASHADGDLRTAILDAQTVAESEGEITPETVEVVREVGVDDEIAGMLEAAHDGDFGDARSILDDLLVDEGYTGAELLEAVLRVAHKRDIGDRARLTRLAGRVDLDLATGTNDRLHLSHLLAELGAPEAPPLSA